MTKLTVNKLRVDLGRKAIISDVSITVALGDWICIIGPNGAGKRDVGI